MASGDNLGNLYIGIEADDSDLAAQLDAAVSVAASAGAEIGSAFTEAAADTSAAFDAFTQAYEASAAAEQQAAAQMSEFVSAQEEWVSSGSAAASAAEETAAAFDSYFGAAGQAAAATEGLGDAEQAAAASAAEARDALQDVLNTTQGVSESSHEAEGGLAGMAEQLIAIGEALVITEGLREFATEALEAYAGIEKATIAMTALTGSAETANEVLERTAKIANDEALSFPELIPAAQKMAALKFTADQTVTALSAVGEASWATGEDVGRLANIFDRMVLSSQTGTRQLTAMGLSQADLKTAMESLGIAADKTWKDLSQPQKIDVLTTAIKGFGDVAEKSAASLSGEWVIAGNQMHEVWLKIGEALAPLAQQILAIMQTDIIPFLEHVIASFSALPEPIKEVTIGIVALAAAAVPATAALGALGLAISGLETLLPAAGGVLSAFTALGEGAGVTFGSMAAVFAGPVIASLLATGEAIDDMHRRFAGLDAELNKQYIISMVQGGVSMKEIIPIAQSMGVSIKQLGDMFGVTSEDIKRASRATSDHIDLSHLFTPAVTASNVAVTAYGIAVKAANEALSDAKKHLQDVTEAYQKQGGSAEDVVKALKEVKAAQAGVTAITEDGGKKAKDVFHGTVIDMDAAKESAVQMGIAYQNTAGPAVAAFAAWLKGRDAAEALANAQVQARDELSNLTPSMVDSAAKMQAAYDALGMKSPQDLQTLADAAKKAYDTIKDDASASADVVQRAYLKMEQAANELRNAKGLESHQEYLDRKKDLDDEVKAEDGAVAHIKAERNSLATELGNLSHQMFQKMEGDLAKDVVTWQGAKKTITDLWQSLAEGILKSMLTVFIQPLETKVAEFAVKLGTNIQSAFHLTTAAATTADAAQTTSKAAAQTKQTASVIAAQAAQTKAVSAAQAAQVDAVGTGMTAQHAAIALANGLSATSYAGVAEAAAYAAYIGIPIIGPELAEAAAADAALSEAPFIAQASAAGGFDVGESNVMTLLHPREMVLPADIAGGLRNMIAGGQMAGAGAGGGGIVMNSPMFNGVSQNMVDDLMNRMVKALRRVNAKI